MGKELYTAKQFIQAIRDSGGIISTIASRVGCSWNTAQKYIKEYATVQAAYQDECNRVNDMARAVLLKSIKDGDTGDAKWWLARKVPNEFAEVSKQRHGGKDDGEIVIKVIYGDDD